MAWSGRIGCIRVWEWGGEWLAGGVAFLGLLPYLMWNALNGWPTFEFWHHYGGIGTSPLDFFGSELTLMNPIAVPLAVAGLVFYFRKSGARFRLLGWTFVFVYLVIIIQLVWSILQG